MSCAEASTLLDPYIDGELGTERSLQFERHCEECQHCAAELQRRRALSAAIRGGLARHRAPPALHRQVRSEIARAARPRGRRLPLSWIRMAASFLLVASVSSSLTYYMMPSHDPVPDEVFASYVRGMQSENRLVDVLSSDQHTVKPWLDGKLDFGVPVKDLAGSGFPLVGGRVDYIGGHPAAALVYHYQKHVITLFIWPTSGPAAPLATSARRGENLATWSDKDMAYWAISDAAAPTLVEFCKRFQTVEPSEAPAATTRPQ